MVYVEHYETSWDADLKQRFDRITKELDEVGGLESNDDKIEIEDVILDWRFAEFLLKNEIYLTRLKVWVETIKKNGLNKKAWDSVKNLEKFLKDIGNKDDMEKDYNKFIEKLRKPKDLHKMKEDEIRKLSLYLVMNEKSALEAYTVMKSFENEDRWFWSATLMWTGMKMEDINVFQKIKKVIKDNYQNNENFIELDYPWYKNLSATSQSIKSFIEAHKWVLSGQWLEWDWTGLTVSHIVDKKNSIVSREVVVTRLNEYNNQRIEKNKKLVEGANINYTASDFTKSNWVLKYKGNEFTIESLRTYFWEEAKTAVKDWDFVNDTEKVRLLEECKDKVFDNMRNKLLSDTNVKDEKFSDKDKKNADENKDSGAKSADKTDDKNKDSGAKSADKTDDKNKVSEVEKKSIGSTSEYVAEKGMIRIMDVKLKNRLKELWFCEKLDWESINFNIDKVREYLIGLQDKSWKDLQRQKPLDKKVWIIAVQVALNHLSKLDKKPKYAVKSVNGAYRLDTINWVKAFQSDNGLKVDGKPWSKTIKKLIMSLSWVTVFQRTEERKEWESSEQLEKKEGISSQIEVNVNNKKVDNKKVDNKSTDNKDLIKSENKVEWKKEVEANANQKTGVDVGTNIKNDSNVSIKIEGNNTGEIIGSKTINVVENKIDIKTKKG